MSTAKIISVNPGVKTRGAIFEEGKRYARAGRALLSCAVKRQSPTGFVDFITGIPARISRKISIKLLAMRLICGSRLVAVAMNALSEDTGDGTAMLELAAGISMATGLFTRIVSLAGATAFGLFAWFTAEAAGAVSADACLMAAFSAGCLMVAVMGPGLFSIDQMIRFLITGPSRRKTASRHSRSAQRLTYRAYWN